MTHLKHVWDYWAVYAYAGKGLHVKTWTRRCSKCGYTEHNVTAPTFWQRVIGS